MPDLDDELLERVARWCAEAGRTTTPAEIRRALGPLGWDELLAVRALLADAPPARPLGPHALADLARGVPAESAAERERDGRYPSEEAPAETPAAATPASPPAVPTRPRKRGPKPAGPVIRRARDAAPPQPAPSPAPPLLDELLLPEGRAVLERFVRRLGARRHALVAALAEGWRRPDGQAVEDADLTALLDHHGLARAFAHREHDELLHALRAAGGLRSAAAARVGLEREAFDAALVRAGASAEAERLREAKRADVRAKATLAERARLLLADPARLEDLGILADVEEDLRRRLPEHLRAVAAAGGPLLPSLATSLSVSPVEAQALLERLGIALGAGLPSAGGSPARARPRSSFGPAAATGGMRSPRRPALARGGGDRAERRGPQARASGLGAPRDRRPGSDRKASGGRPPREENRSGARPGGRPDRRDRPAGAPARDGRDRPAGAPTRDRRDRRPFGTGAPRERRGVGAEEELGAPRGRGERGLSRRPGPATPGKGPPRSGRPQRPGGPGGKPPPRKPRRP